MTSIISIAVAALAMQPIYKEGLLNVNVGDKYTYKTTTDVSSEMFSSSTKETNLVEVTGMADGWYKISVTTTEHEADNDGPGQVMAGNPKGMVVSHIVSPTRKMKGWKVEDAGEMPDGFAEGSDAKAQESNGFQNLVLPDGELSVGTKWKQETMPPSMRFGPGETESEGKINVSYEVTRFEGEGANRMITINAEADGDISMFVSSDQGEFDIDMSIKEKRKYLVRATDGVLVKLEITSARTMATDFGEFEIETKIKTELSKD